MGDAAEDVLPALASSESSEIIRGQPKDRAALMSEAAHLPVWASCRHGRRSSIRAVMGRRHEWTRALPTVLS